MRASSKLAPTRPIQIRWIIITQTNQHQTEPSGAFGPLLWASPWGALGVPLGYGPSQRHCRCHCRLRLASRGRQLPGRDAQGRAAPIKTELDIAKNGKPVFLDNAAHDFDEGWTVNTLSSPSYSNSPGAVRFRPNLAQSPDFDVNDRNIDSLDFDDFERLMPYEFSEDSKGGFDLNLGDVRNSFSKGDFYGSFQLEAAAPARAVGAGERPPPAPDPAAGTGELTGELTATQLPPPTPLL